MEQNGDTDFTVPFDEEGYVKSFTSEESDSFVPFFWKYGFVVIRDIIPPEYVEGNLLKDPLERSSRVVPAPEEDERARGARGAGEHKRSKRSKRSSSSRRRRKEQGGAEASTNSSVATKEDIWKNVHGVNPNKPESFLKANWKIVFGSGYNELRGFLGYDPAVSQGREERRGEERRGEERRGEERRGEERRGEERRGEERRGEERANIIFKRRGTTANILPSCTCSPKFCNKKIFAPNWTDMDS
jgi:hypothetical protein